MFQFIRNVARKQNIAGEQEARAARLRSGADNGGAESYQDKNQLEADQRHGKPRLDERAADCEYTSI
jgi:hypothetical protein